MHTVLHSFVSQPPLIATPFGILLPISYDIYYCLRLLFALRLYDSRLGGDRSSFWSSTCICVMMKSRRCAVVCRQHCVCHPSVPLVIRLLPLSSFRSPCHPSVTIVILLGFFMKVGGLISSTDDMKTGGLIGSTDHRKYGALVRCTDHDGLEGMMSFTNSIHWGVITSGLGLDQQYRPRD